MTSFSFFKYFDAFELDVNVVNFVYYGKTRVFRSFGAFCEIVRSFRKELSRKMNQYKERSLWIVRSKRFPSFLYQWCWTASVWQARKSLKKIWNLLFVTSWDFVALHLIVLICIKFRLISFLRLNRTVLIHFTSLGFLGF